MSAPEFWIVAGPNGAGKTTCAKSEPMFSMLPDVPFLNPDERTLAKLQSLGYQGFLDSPADVQMRLFFESADEVFADLQQAISKNTPIGVETVLSSDKYCSIVETVREKQGFIGLIYVALASPFLAKQRVAARVQRGGHGIPEDKIEQRWRRSLDNLPWFACRASAFWVIDNSESNPDTPRLLVANGKQGRLEELNEAAFPELKAALSSLP
jgi:predicted ABC-type ATPase